ncbi:spore germination protein GerW family protein [Actinoplanes sp. NPDC051861]|uniref:spore germination protein GerW family protein n=1 Tax=Actinoplanes sp. NPDC051861 TaxID=3155170 RepID=UPI0034347498
MALKLDSNTILEKAREGTDAATAARVFGTPVEKDGVVVVPVAIVSGGGGGGSGSGTAAAKAAAATGDDSADGAGGKDQEGEGSGGGFGFSARPAGVFVLRNGEVTWKPAVDVNKIVMGGQLVLITALLVARSVIRRRRRR